MLHWEDNLRRVELGYGSDARLSEREYAEITIQTVTEQDYDYYSRGKQIQQRSFYLDPLTGLVVFDIAEYEKWAPKPEPVAVEEEVGQFGRFGE